MSHKHLLVSCWAEHDGAPGMKLFRFDCATGKTQLVKTVEESLSCNCSTYNPDTKILYITNEVHNNPDYPKGGGGLIYAFKFDNNAEEFVQISRVESSCPCPAYLALDASKKYLLCANHSSFNAATRAVKGADGFWHTEVIYDDAIVGLFRLNNDGSIGPLVDVKKHDKYPVVGRGLHAHPHSCNMTPDGKFHVCCDKGDSHIYFYQLDYAKEELVLATEPYHDNVGASPRYCAFHPTQKWMFVNHERDTHASAFAYDQHGNLSLLNSCDVLPPSQSHEASVVREELHHKKVAPPRDGIWPLEQQGFVISSDGKFLYDAVNGADAISVLSVNQKDGTISLLQTLPVEARWVRGCMLSPDGKFLAVCALQEGGLFIYKINPDGTVAELVANEQFRGGSYISFLD